ncbi:polysaccharide deacetylase family protein [Micromonospora peucetia]|uniref:Peptidoglycan/xylan/chitin deacetylase, PgdA/CDA1 family n=1 Tax=Micromonospora peucetia TaxID=47871 RepID=A0A1C6USM5_9ACTN|nr:polysaccharide deacetylase family protein [Micromonospora peucetia]MCX4387418.1 polysaccharide deacetylase family protein [Micromonospora peucetia]WSA34744.1 polysaccharide deacetylase family protein [Micromonospora peucetia]SCL56980.1 Peptidoglycan/xylan/chitin deacetylase, PgdA/CDA1 family [Micromonospora peucetia]
MRPRAVLASGLALLILLGGCGDGSTADRSAAGPSPVASAPLPTEPAPSVSPQPTRSTPPRRLVRPLPAKLPAGLRRTTGVRTVALTFDDGPDPAWTPKILDRLRAARVTATFCVVGTQARRHPDLVRRIVREGHQLCNHSWQHDLDLARRPVAEIRRDLVRTNAAIRAAVPDAKVPFYRQPGGRWTREVVTVAKQLGMRSLHWDVDPQDWGKPTAATIIKRVRAAARPGSVVLLHDGGGNRAATLAACSHLITDLKRRYGIAPLR